MNRREILLGTGLAAINPNGPRAAQSLHRIIKPREDVPLGNVESGNAVLRARGVFPEPRRANYLYITIEPKGKIANCWRSIATDLYTADLILPQDPSPLSLRPPLEPIKDIGLYFENHLHHFHGDFWFLVDEQLVLGDNTCALLSTVPPGGKVSITLADNTEAGYYIYD